MSALRKKVWVGIECLLDFRLGAILTIDPIDEGRAYAYTSTPAYYTRVSDDLNDPVYGHLPKELLYRVIDTDFKAIMQLSPVTRLPEVLFDMGLYFMRAASQGQEPVEPVFVISVWPAKLTDAEVSDLRRTIQASFSNLLDIEIVQYPVSLVSPEIMRREYVAAFLYRHDWLDLYAEDIKANAPNPDLRIFVPRLMMGDTSNKAAKMAVRRNKVDPYEHWEFLMSRALPLESLPPSLVSARTPANIKAYDHYQLMEKYLGEETVPKPG